MKIIKGQLMELVITDLAFGGRGIAKISNETEGEKDLVVFIDGALPGQKIKAQITKKKKRYAEGKCVEILERSPDEVETGFQSIPGAPWSRLPIEIQQKYKKQQVQDLFKKMADIDLNPVWGSFLSSPVLWEYRNKMEYSFGPTEESYTLDEDNKKIWEHEGFGLGSKKRGQYHLVEALENPSGLFDVNFETCIPEFQALCKSCDPRAYNAKTVTGFWRQLTVRKSFSEDQFLLDIITADEDLEASKVEEITAFWTEKLGRRLGGICWTKSDDTGNPHQKFASRNFVFGTEKIKEILEVNYKKLTFEISVDSFFQTNVRSAESLYAKALSYVELTLEENTECEILDLFCGTGTISQIVAQNFPKASVVGVEIVEAAVKDAEVNADRNGIKNVKFIAADVYRFMRTFGGEAPTLILDPPRAGIAPKGLERIIKLGARYLVYISCNPATMARDAETLKKGGYDLMKFSLVDQFPHTAHVESVGLFKRDFKQG